jgi:hypothetical protein
MKKRYAVVFCQNCKKPRIIETEHSTTKCTHCNKRYQTIHLQKYFETNSQGKARIAIGYLNARQDKNKNKYIDECKS